MRGHGWSALSGHGPSWLVPAMSAVGIALSVGSWSATRDASPFDSALLIPAVPVVMVAAALVLAAVAKKRRVGLRDFARPSAISAAVLTVAEMLAVPLVHTLSASERVALGVAVALVEGISATLFMYVFLASLVRFSPKTIALAVASGYLLVHLYDGLFLAAPEGVRVWQRYLALLSMAVLAAVLARDMRMSAQPGAIKAKDAPEGAAACPGTTARDCVVFVCLVSVMLLIQGVYSQITGLGSVGNVEAFNLFTEVFAAGVRAAVLAYCVLRAGDLSMPRVSACAVVILLAGIPIVVLSWGTDSYLVGSHIVNSARYVLLPLVAIACVQAARRTPDGGAPLILLAVAATNSCYVSRLITAQAFANTAYDIDGALSGVSLCSLWVIACVVPACLLFERYLHGRESGAGREGAALAAADATRYPGFEREIAFFQKLEQICDRAEVTDREREVLREVLHGYSISNIATRLNLSASSVKTYLSRAYGRFGVSSRQDVLALLDEENE